VRVGQQHGIKAKWVHVELRKVETLPGGGQGNTFYDIVGPGPQSLWQAREEWDLLRSVSFGFHLVATLAGLRRRLASTFSYATSREEVFVVTRTGFYLLSDTTYSILFPFYRHCRLRLPMPRLLTPRHFACSIYGLYSDGLHTGTDVQFIP
jgi:hypothetical protein